jgi:hypothetical protein
MIEARIGLSIVSVYPSAAKKFGSSRFCVIGLSYIGSFDLCVLCVFVVRSTPSLRGMYLRIHFTHQTWESQNF